MSSFDALGLSPALIRWIETEGFAEPTEIQARAVPLMSKGKDLLATARTGEGKTAAYLWPILNRMLDNDGEATVQPIPHRPQVLILAPTRELAAQIGATLKQFCKGMRMYYTVLFGGVPFKTQERALDRGVQFVIATPGRLLEHLGRGTLRLDRIEAFVLDEADRMLDMGFVKDVSAIAERLPRAHQTAMFSATMSEAVRALAAKLLHDPARIDVGRENSVATSVDHRVMLVRHADKKRLLHHVLARPSVRRSLVFVRTKAMADSLTRDLRAAGFAADAIHGDRDQSTRQKVLEGFRDGAIAVLVATDVAARGLDIAEVSQVINFDMPIEGEAYVHRVGRTGRAGQRGTALSICTASDAPLLRNAERTIGQKVPVDRDHPYHDGAAARGTGPAHKARDAASQKPAKKPHRKDAPRRADERSGAPKRPRGKPGAPKGGAGEAQGGFRPRTRGPR